jgi:hypothetical protein
MLDMANEIKYTSSGKIPFEVLAITKTTRAFSIKRTDITDTQAETICEYINKDNNTKVKCKFEYIYDPFLKENVYYFTFQVFKSRVGLETPLYNAISLYLDNATKSTSSAPTPAPAPVPTPTPAPKSSNTLRRGQTFKSAAQMQGVFNSFTLPITGTIVDIVGKKPNYEYKFNLPYWDDAITDNLYYEFNKKTNYLRLWSKQVRGDLVRFTFEEKPNTTSVQINEDYNVIDKLIEEYLKLYLALKKAPATIPAPQTEYANLDGIKLGQAYYLMPLTEVQVYKEDVFNVPIYSFYLTGMQYIFNITNHVVSFINTDTAFGLAAKSTLLKANPDLYKIEFEIVSSRLIDEEATFVGIDEKLNRLGYKNPFTSAAPTKALVQTQSDLLGIETEVEKLKTELDQLVFLRSLNSQLDFEKNIELGQKIANVKEKINELNFDKLQAKITTDDIFDQLFEQSFTPLQHEYTNVKLALGESDDFFTPNGQPSVLSEQLNEIIRTEQFKQWFGDWQLTYNYKQAGETYTDCSVVLTENFEPKLFYHGTGQAFSYFKFDKFPAAYFAANPDYSKFFANLHGGDEGYVIPFFLNVRNPLDLTLFGTELIKPKEFFDYLYLQTGFEPEYFEPNPLFFNPTAPPVECWRYLRNNPKMLKKLAENEVYDGIHFYETNPGVPVGLPAYKTEVFITFKPDQCKIADNNRGLILLGALKSFLLEKGGKI